MKTLARRISALIAAGAMKNSIAIVLLASALSTSARPIRIWSEAEMQKGSDLIVIGTVANVRDLDEINAELWPNFKFRGVETTFAVSQILKGDLTNRTVVLHHYRFEPHNFIPPNGPCFLNLNPTDTNQYRLYLVKDGPARYAPVSGQRDPAMDAVRPLSKATANAAALPEIPGDQDVIRFGVRQSSLIISGKFLGTLAGGGGATSTVAVDKIFKSPPDFENSGHIAVYWFTDKSMPLRDTIANTNQFLFFLRPKHPSGPTGYADVTPDNHRFVRATEVNLRLVESELRAHK